MTSLEDFLKNEKKQVPIKKEPTGGSFSCQHEDCNEVVSDGYIDRYNNRLHWVCINGHESSVIV